MKRMVLVLIGVGLLSCSQPKQYTVEVKGSESMHEIFVALKNDYEKL